MNKLLYILVLLFPVQISGQLLVHQDGKYGYINPSGELAIPFLFEKAEEFLQGKASVKVNGKWGLIDEKGQYLIQPEYEKITALGGNLAGLKENNLFGIINYRTKEEIPPIYNKVEPLTQDWFLGYKENICGLYSIAGENLLPSRYLRIEFDESERYIVAFSSKEKVVYNLKLDSLQSFNVDDEIRLFPSFLVHKQNDRWRQVYDYNGRFVDSIPKAVAEPINDRFLKFTHYSDSQSICINGPNSAICFPLSSYNTLSNKYYVIGNHTKKVALFDTLGRKLTDFDFLNIDYNPVTKLYFYSDESGTKIGSNSKQFYGMESCEQFSFLSSKIIMVKKRGKWGAININGEDLIKCSFDWFEGDSNSIKAYSDKGLLLAEFNALGNLVEQRLFKNFSQINVTKNSFLPPTQSFWGPGNRPQPLCLNPEDFGWFNVKRGKKYVYGLLDLETGDTLISPRYTSLCVYDSLGNTKVAIEKKKKGGQTIFNQVKPRYNVYGIVNSKGKRLLPMQYVAIDEQSLRDSSFEFLRTIHEKNGGGVNLVKIGDRKYRNNFRFVDRNYHGLARATRKGKIVKKSSNDAIMGSDQYYVNSFADKQDYSFRSRFPVRGFSIEAVEWGFINRAGEEVIPFEYDYVTNFKNGISFVRKKENWGAIDTTGKVIIPIQYAYIEFASWNKKHIVKVYNDSKNWGVLDAKGNELISPQYKIIHGYYHKRLLVGQSMRRLFYINEKGERLYQDLKIRNTEPFVNGRAPAWINRKWGVIDTAGNIVVEPKFKKLSLYNENYFVGVETWKSELYNYDKQKVLKGKIKYFTKLDSNFFVGAKKWKKGLYSYDGKKVLSPRYSSIISPDGNGYLVSKKGKQGWVNKEGKLIVKPKFQDVFPSKENRILALKDRTVYGFDQSGRKVFAKPFLDVNQFASGLAPVKTKKGWGAIDSTGEMVIKDEYSYLEPFIDSTAVGRTKNRVVLVYVDGNKLHNKEYAGIREYSEGFYKVYFNEGGVNFINSRGGYVNDVHYHEVRPFKGEYAVVYKGWSGKRKAGAIDLNGNEVIQCKYQDLRVIPGFGFAYKQNETFGFYDLKGKQITSLELAEEKFKNNVLQITKGNQIGYLKRNGEIIWNLN